MNSRTVLVGFVSLALLGGAGVMAFSRPLSQPPNKEMEEGAEEAAEQVIDLAKAPEAVRTAALKLVGNGGAKAITKVIREEDEEEIYTYEIEYLADGVQCTAVLSTAGDVMELEKSVKEASLPKAVIAALKKEYPKAAFKDPNSVQKFYFEIEVVIDGKAHEVKVDAAGNIEDEHGQEDEDGDHADGDHGRDDEGHEGKKGEEDDDEDEG